MVATMSRGMTTTNECVLSRLVVKRLSGSRRICGMSSGSGNTASMDTMAAIGTVTGTTTVEIVTAETMTAMDAGIGTVGKF